MEKHDYLVKVRVDFPVISKIHHSHVFQEKSVMLVLAANIDIVATIAEPPGGGFCDGICYRPGSIFHFQKSRTGPEF